MAEGQVKCTHCECYFPLNGESAWTVRGCPMCGEVLQVHAFPALKRPLRHRTGRNAAAEEGQAVCFFHSHKPAAQPCDACGRFLCELCDFRSRDKHYCATCLDSARRSGKGLVGAADLLLKDRVFLPQSLALGLAFYAPLSMVGLYVVPLTAPAAIWVSIRYWKNRDGFQVRGRWRFIAAILLGSFQLLATAIAAVFLAFVFREAMKK